MLNQFAIDICLVLALSKKAFSVILTLSLLSTIGTVLKEINSFTRCKSWFVLVVLDFSSFCSVFLYYLGSCNSVLFLDCFFSKSIDGKSFFSIGLIDPASAATVDFLFSSLLFCIKICFPSCFAFLFSHLFQMFVFWNMFDQKDQNRVVDSITDVVLLLSILQESSYSKFF